MTTTAISASTWIVILLLGGIAGMLGQVARTAVGLKKVNDLATAEGKNPEDLIIASRLFISIAIGFTAGALTAVVMGLQVTDIRLEQILGLAAAGYAGTDAIEGLISRVTPATEAKPAKTGDETTTKTTSAANTAAAASDDHQG